MRRAPRRQQTGENSDAQTDDRSERENTNIRRNFIDARNARRQKRFQRIDTPDRYQQSGEAAEYA